MTTAEHKAAIRAKCQEILELEAKATPGPWEARFFYRLIQVARRFAAEARILLQPKESKDWPDSELTVTARNYIRPLAEAVLAFVDESCRECLDTGEAGAFGAAPAMSWATKCPCNRPAMIANLAEGLK